MKEHELTKNAVSKGQTVIICTSHDKLGDTDKPTGSWLEEVAAPYYVFKDAGYDVTIASIKGGKVPMDPASLEANGETEATQRFQKDEEAQQQLNNSVALESLTDPTFYDAIFVPGGHGVCYDLPGNFKFAQFLTDAYAAGKVISAVCHGPTGLVSVQAPDGKPIVNGKKVTGFSNAEEDAVQKAQYVPFLLEDKLKELGGLYERGDVWQDYAVADGHLVTGQNPMSSHQTATLVVKALSASQA